MAIAPVAVLLIGGAWWFGESRVPRHGWVSEKVQWHWAVHREQTGDIFQTVPWYRTHGGERVARVTIDVAGGRLAIGSTSVFRPTSAIETNTVRLTGAKRAWGRFPGSELIWRFEESAHEIVLIAPDSKRLRVKPPMRDNVFLMADVFIGSERHTNAYFPFQPDPTGNGWFIVIDNEVIHQEFSTGQVNTVLHAADHLEIKRDAARLWRFEPVLASNTLAILYDSGSDGLIVDLATWDVVTRVNWRDARDPITVALTAAGKDEATKESFRRVSTGGPLWSNYQTDLTEDQSCLLHWWRPRDGPENLLASDLDHGQGVCRFIPPQDLLPWTMETFTTGPGPRDVNVFYIDGGQLILAVYELPEAE